jgi:hypothetical protein
MANPSMEFLTCWGFGIQDGQGQKNTSDLTWLPLNAASDFNLNPNLELTDQADGFSDDRLMHSRGIWMEGNGGVSCQPVAGSLANLLEWVFDRDDYCQGKWATVVYSDGRRVYQYPDVKVASARFSLSAGAPLGLELRLLGIGEPFDSPIISPGLIQDGAPYTFDETKVQVDWDSSGTVHSNAETTLKSLELEVDNQLQGGEEGLRLCESLYPQTGYNNGAGVYTGSFVRDYIDSTTESQDPFELWIKQIGAAYSDDYNGMLKVTLSRGGVALVLSMPNTRFRTSRQPATGSRRGTINQTVEFQALTNAAGDPAVEYDIL